jgi:hypothetical protein
MSHSTIHSDTTHGELLTGRLISLEEFKFLVDKCVKDLEVSAHTEVLRISYSDFYGYNNQQTFNTEDTLNTGRVYFKVI